MGKYKQLRVKPARPSLKNKFDEIKEFGACGEGEKLPSRRNKSKSFTQLGLIQVVKQYSKGS